MKLLLDLQVLQSESRDRGIGRYSRGLANAMLGNARAQDASVLLNLSLAPVEQFDLVRHWTIQRIPAARLHLYWGLTRVAGMHTRSPAVLDAADALYDSYISSLGVDLVHIASPFEGFGDDTVVGGSRLAREGPVRAATVYDFIPFIEPELYLADPAWNSFYRRRLSTLKQVDLVLAISEHTRRLSVDILGLSSNRVVNIGADTDAVFRKIFLSPSEKQALLNKYDISKPFLMHTGILEGRKNVTTLIRAFAQLPPAVIDAHQLVLVADATEPQIESMRSVARLVHLDPSCLRFPGFVGDEDLAKLYGLAAVAVMPSLTEGFGLPLLEAMRCGAPVLGSERTSVPEVVGNSDLLFDPTNAADLAAKLALILTDEGFRERAIAHGALQEKKFSWRRSSEMALAAFEDAVARKRAISQPSRQRPQYMLIPPADTDAELNAGATRIASSLSEHGEVIVDAADARIVKNQIDAGVFTVPTKIWQLGMQRRTIMISGSGSLDRYQEAILQSVPAVVVSLRPDSDSISREQQYLVGGYAAVSAAGSSPTGFPTNSAARVQILAQVLARLQDGPNVACDIETAYQRHSRGVILRLLAEIPPLEPPDRVDVAIAASENHPARPTARRLLVDISELVHRDAATGIQRVVKNVLGHLLRVPSEFRVEPVYRDGTQYRFARKFTCRFLGLPPLDLPDGVVDFQEKDAFFGLDLDANLGPAAAVLTQLRRRGGHVYFLVHDFLPIMRPDWFPPGTGNAFEDWIIQMSRAATGIIAVSRVVADDVVTMLTQRGEPRIEPILISWCHNGADLAPTNRVHAPQNDDAQLAKLVAACKDRPVFLTVGTVEPRKGVGDLIDAAEDLWLDHDAVFIIVGKKGWLVDELIERIAQHPEHGGRLFWLGGGVGDETLEALYEMATALVLPSYAEGFGLPLVEGARRGVPIIARDIPVFREIGGEGVYYYAGGSGADLAVGIREWLTLQREGTAPRPDRIKILNWAECTQQMLAVIRGELPYRRWPE